MNNHGPTATLQFTPVSSITFRLDPTQEPVLIIDQDGFKYKGELVEDAGRAHKIWCAVMSGRAVETDPYSEGDLEPKTSWWERLFVKRVGASKKLFNAETEIAEGRLAAAIRSIRDAARELDDHAQEIVKRTDAENFRYVNDAIEELKKTGEPDLIPGGWGIAIYVERLVGRYIKLRDAQ